MSFLLKKGEKVHYLKECGSARSRVSHLLLISQVNNDKMMTPYQSSIKQSIQKRV